MLAVFVVDAVENEEGDARAVAVVCVVKSRRMRMFRVAADSL